MSWPIDFNGFLLYLKPINETEKNNFTFFYLIGKPPETKKNSLAVKLMMNFQFSHHFCFNANCVSLLATIN